jgi:hypothetical protein
MFHAANGNESHYWKEGFIMEMARRKFRLGWFGLFLLASVMMFGCGGGGGDDGGTAPQPAPTVPDPVNFTISQSANVPLMSATVLMGDSNFGVQLLGIVPPGVQGTYSNSSKALNLNSGAFTFNTTAPDYSAYTSIRVEIAERVVLQGDDDPTAGKLDIEITTTEPEPAYTFVTLTFSVTGVTINTYETRGGPPIPGGNVTYTWSAFENLADTAPPNEQFAKFSYGIWSFMLEQVSIAFDAMAMIIDNEDELVDGTQPIPGATLPWGGTGNIVINSSGSGVQPGFDFELIYTNWWINDTTDNVDDIYPSGSLALLGYIENDGGPIGGDFEFTNFVRQETVDNQAPNPADLTLTVNGGFGLLVSW